MNWYRCSCGFTTEMAPRLGYEIVSVIHLHPAARVDGTAAIVRMEEVPPRAPGENPPSQPSRAADELGPQRRAA